ncbi:LysR family transcriptional regulator [Glutamicibacter endophyticus]|uniref:LysR family transcriptional regulator n=1 Tax=Glutamicibacter endophyticus TaxID=1522174 RepID=UPI003AF05069
MTSLRDLEYFLAVMDRGNVSSAAAELFVSQPAISRRLANLERHWGTTLFQRSAQGMRPTAAALRLQELARDVVKRAARTEHIMERFGREDLSFTVVCPHSTATSFVAPLLAEGARIADVTSEQPDLVYAHLERGIDLAVNTRPAPPHYACERIFSSPVFAYFRPEDLPEDHSPHLGLDAFAGRRLFAPGFGSAVETTVRGHAADAGFDLAGLSTTTNGTVAQAHAAAGHGIALATEPASFSLASAPLHAGGHPVMIDFYAAWEPEHYAKEELRLVVAELEASMPRTWKHIMGAWSGRRNA